ncbi:MAG: hypothetical protein F6K56_27380 [Moorea sp. SIO3G5]|nr:hypothetical protein [Moorena sp. SIO3G5]
MLTNDILDEIHKFREDYAKAFNYDVAAMFVDWRNRQTASGRKAVTLPPKKSNQTRALHQDSEMHPTELEDEEEEKIVQRNAFA